MSLDVQSAPIVAGGETHLPPPIYIEGLRLMPSIETLSSQITADGITKLYARLSAGRARIVDFATDFRTDEYTVVDFTTENRQYDQDTDDDGTPDVDLSSGNAVWFAAVAVQHRPNGSVDILFVPGTIAAVASAAVPDQDTIEAYIGSNKSYAILGDILFYRSADTTIKVRVNEERRAAYVDEDNKTGVTCAQDDQASLASEFLGFLNIPADLTSLSAVADAGTYINGIPLPNTPFGGYIKGWRYVPTVAGGGAGADINVNLALDGTDVTGGNLNITLANSAIGQGVGDYSGLAANKFVNGDTLDVEVISTPTNFTSGSGFFIVELWKYIQ